MEGFRTSVEHGVASLQSYLSSLQVRGDTQLSLVLGVLAGLVIVVVIGVYPGKPIDYTGLGIDLPPGLRGKESVEDAEGRKSKKHDREEEPPGTQLVDPKNPDGLQQIQGLVENLSELRRRKKAKRATTQSPPAPAPAPAPAASEDPLVRNTTTGVGGEVEGEWDARRLDEDKLARKIGSSKAARMLGLTEEQVRQAVVEAKEELQQSQSTSTSGGSAGRHNNNDDIGVSGFLSLVVLITGLGAVWVYISTNPHGTLSRFLIGIFPREMETLGLAS